MDNYFLKKTLGNHMVYLRISYKNSGTNHFSLINNSMYLFSKNAYAINPLLPIAHKSA